MSQDPWKGLREKLEERKWPAVYLFKFIVPADNQKVAQTEAFLIVIRRRLSCVRVKPGSLFRSVRKK